MLVLSYIVFISFIGISCGGLILHNIRDSLHSKIYGHGLHGERNQNSPVISINNQQQVSLAAATIPTNHHQPQQHQYGLNQRGDYGSLPSSGHHSYGSDIDSNFKAGGVNYHRRGGYSYGSHSMGSDFGGGSSHHMMKQESYNHRHGPKFGHRYDDNMFGNAQGLAASNYGIRESLSSSSASASSSSAASSSFSSSSSSAPVFQIVV